MYVRSYFVKDSVSICQDTRSHLTVWFVYIYTAGGGGGGGQDGGEGVWAGSLLENLLYLGFIQHLYTGFLNKSESKFLLMNARVLSALGFGSW